MKLPAYVWPGKATSLHLLPPLQNRQWHIQDASPAAQCDQSEPQEWVKSHLLKASGEIQPKCCAQKSRRYFQWKMHYSILKCYVENRTLYHLLSYRPIKPQYSKYSAGISMVFCIITQIKNRVLLKEALYASNLHSRWSGITGIDSLLLYHKCPCLSLHLPRFLAVHMG